jgi:Flp pilus assembly protein TadG
MKNRTPSECARSTSKAMQAQIVRATILKKHAGPGPIGASRAGRASRGETSRARGVARWFGEFCTDDSGIGTLEYVLVLPLFLAVVIGTFQFGMMFVTQSLMDNAARDAARLIRIGTFTGTSGNYSTGLVAAVCNDLTVSGYNLVPACTANIQIYVAAASSGTPAGVGFTTVKVSPISNGAMTQSKATLAPKSDVILQIGYDMPWVASLFSGTALLMSTLAFQTEPY